MSDNNYLKKSLPMYDMAALQELNKNENNIDQHSVKPQQLPKTKCGFPAEPLQLLDMNIVNRFDTDLNIPQPSSLSYNTPLKALEIKPKKKKILTTKKCYKKVDPLSNHANKARLNLPEVSENRKNFLESTKENKPINPGPESIKKQNEVLKINLKKKVKGLSEVDHKQASCSQEQSSKACKNKKPSYVRFLLNSHKKLENIKYVPWFASILHKIPFKPNLQKRNLKSIPFNLQADKRVAERKLFDNMLKQKEEKKKQEEQMREKTMMKFKKQQQANYRARLVHHAKPAPDMTKPFIPKKSKTPLTIPMSPTRKQK